MFYPSCPARRHGCGPRSCDRLAVGFGLLNAVEAHRAQPPAQLPPLSARRRCLNKRRSRQPGRSNSTDLVAAEGRIGRWQLWAGNQLLKDFGGSEREAQEALQVFRDLRVNSHGTIGGVFDYWLTDGEAPSAFTRHKMVIPFDPHTLRVEQITGQWVLRDAHIVLYSFGRSQTDAQQALAVCQHYEFDQLGYRRPPDAVAEVPDEGPSRRGRRCRPSHRCQPVSAAMQPAEVARPRLVLPGVGDVGDRVPFDGRRLDLRREGGEWVLYAGRTPVGHFGPADRDARTALETLEQFRVTELCRIGDSGFGFFLSNGRAPPGPSSARGPNDCGPTP